MPNDRSTDEIRKGSFVAREQQRRKDRPRRAASDGHIALTHEDRLIARRGHLIHKLKAKDSTGRWAYYVLLVAPRNEKRFLADLRNAGSMDLAGYGEILASNYGDEPSAQTRADMKRRFGFDL